MNILGLLYKFLCIAGSVIMTIFCFHKYSKNESVVSVTYKKFHDTPEDVFPSFSVCFENGENELFVDVNGFKNKDIVNMMRGVARFNQSLFLNTTYQDMTLKLPIKVFKYLTENRYNKYSCC